MYNKQYFIEKFSKIPGGDIGRGQLDKHCALHHCGVTPTPDGKEYVMTDESKALGQLLAPFAPGHNDEPGRAVWWVNDQAHSLGATPKERILNALAQLPDPVPAVA